MSIQDRLSKPEYQNWLKGGQALLTLLNSLRKFADKTINDYHVQLKTQLGTGTCQQQCKPKKDPGSCAVCGLWKQELMVKHSNKIVFWSNVNPTLWPTAPWEMAKFYMPRGQKHTVRITAKDLDSTHMMNLLRNCKEFHQYFSNKNLPQKMLQIRNQLMHSSNMTVADTTLKNAIDDILQFLQDKTYLHQLKEVQDAIKEIQELRNMTFDLTVDSQPSQPNQMTIKTAECIEETLIRDVIGHFEERLEALECLSNDVTDVQGGDTEDSERLSQTIADFQQFVNDNADLKMKFGREIEDVRGRCERLEERVEEINNEVAILGVRVEALETAPPSDYEITPDKEPPSSFDLFFMDPSGFDPFMLKAIALTLPVVVCLFAIAIGLLRHKSSYISNSGPTPAASYKNLLQEKAQDLKIDRPVYEWSHEEHGHKCTVTVDGSTYKTPRFYHNKKECQQAVAELAYRILRTKHKELDNGEKTIDSTNYVGQLQEYQQRRGLSISKPDYHPKSTENLKFTARVTVELSGGGTQEFETQGVENSMKEAKHAVAKIALRALQGGDDQPQEQPPAALPMETTSADGADESSGIPFKSKLQEYQQKLGLDKPTYITTQDGTRFQSMVTVPVDKKGGRKVFEGTMAEGSKKEAEHRAAKKALESLVETNQQVAPVVTTLPKTSMDSNPVPQRVKTSKDSNPMPQEAKTSKDSNPMSHEAKSDDQGDCAAVIPYKSKLQEYQQKLGLPKPTYTMTQDGTQFQSTVTVPIDKEGAVKVFEGEMAEGSKKDAEHRAAKKALATLGGVDKSCASVGDTPSKMSKDSNPVPHKAKSDDQGESASDSTANFKGELQEQLQQSQGITKPPKYEDIEIRSQPGSYRSKVTLSTKYIIQNEHPHSSKKEAEKAVARLALKQLGIPNWDTHANPKGKLQELSPNSKPVYETDDVGKQFHCTLISSVLDTLNEVVVFADGEGKSKRERKELQQGAAKKILDWLKKV